MYGHFEIVEYLAKKGADVSAQVNSALFNASVCWHLLVVDVLLNRGARDHGYRALTKLIENKEEEEEEEVEIGKEKEDIVKRLLEYYYPREVIEDLLLQTENPKIISLLQDYLNQKFLISPQDQKILRS